MGSNSHDDFVRPYPLIGKGTVILSFYFAVALVNQDPVINSKLAGLFNLNSTSFDVDLLEGVVDLVVDCCYSVQPFFGGGRGEFIVIVDMNGARVPAI